MPAFSHNIAEKQSLFDSCYPASCLLTIPPFPLPYLHMQVVFEKQQLWTLTPAVFLALTPAPLPLLKRAAAAVAREAGMACRPLLAAGTASWPRWRRIPQPWPRPRTRSK